MNKVNHHQGRESHQIPERQRRVHPFPNRPPQADKGGDTFRLSPFCPELAEGFDFRLFHSSSRLRPPAYSLRVFLLFIIAATITLLTPTHAHAGDGKQSQWLNEISRQLTTPLFWFGIIAQAMFFMRFFWQWLISEKRKQSTVPVVFWYFSLAGGICMFIYACLRPDLVIMLGQALACVIYIRNLMLIYQRADRRRRAGLPPEDLGSVVQEEDLPD